MYTSQKLNFCLGVESGKYFKIFKALKKYTYKNLVLNNCCKYFQMRKQKHVLNHPQILITYTTYLEKN